MEFVLLRFFFGGGGGVGVGWGGGRNHKAVILSSGVSCINCARELSFSETISSLT